MYSPTTSTTSPVGCFSTFGLLNQNATDSSINFTSEANKVEPGWKLDLFLGSSSPILKDPHQAFKTTAHLKAFSKDDHSLSHAMP